MRLRPRASALAVTLALLAGCNADAPTGPAPRPSLAAAASGCQAVAFSSVFRGTFPSFAGTMTGDLVGTLQVLQDASTVVATNPKYARAIGGYDFQVTSSKIAALAGRSFHLTASSWNRQVADADPLFVEAGGHSIGVEGLAMANLAFYGGVDISGGVTNYPVYLDWHGVICP